MKGDFSRDTYAPANAYSRVLMQQGRVQIDADWNEQTAILLGYMRALTRDVFGPAAGPDADCGFLIVTPDNRAALPKPVADAVDAALKADGGSLDDDALVMPGRYYVGGLPVEIAQPVRYRAQPGFAYDAGKVDGLKDKAWFAYLDVWEDYVAPDQEPHIREVALDGVDTCGRARVLWQVRLSADAKDQDALATRAPTGSGRLSARANPGEDTDTLCAIAPDARYRGAENQLYRVEIHAGGAAGVAAGSASFKWSRDNGAIVFPVVASAGTHMTLAHLGRDATMTLTEGDWVELVDDAMLAGGGVGILAQVASVARDDLAVDLTLPDGAPALPTLDAPAAAARHALLRRWDHRGDPKKSGGALAIVEGDTGEVELEDGVMVRFEAGGAYRAGDYWLIPARVATGDVEWPGPPDAPAFKRPDGPSHVYAPLAARTLSAAGAPTLGDLRCRIARLPCIDAAKRNR